MKMTLTTNDKERQLSLLIDCKNGRLGKNLTADEAEQVVQHLDEQLHQAGREAFKQWLLRFESDAETLEIDGKIYRFKMVAEKEILTKFGHVTIPRRLYQQDAGGPVYVPLDAAWNMQGQFAAADVRESLLFLAAHLSPGEVVACLDKVSSFTCSKTTVQNIVDEMGEILEDHEDELMETVRLAEELPVAKTKCVAVSLDGVNVRLNTPGPKKGRPTERPKDEASMSRETASCYKNAMVGDLPSRRTELPLVGTNRKMVASLPILLAVRTEQRISARKYQRSNAQRVTAPSGSSKCLDGRSLNDGGTNLWNYADAETLYDGFEKIVDFHHVLDHVSSGAEGIFGKAAADGQAWYRKMEGTLLSYTDGAERVIRSLEYFLNAYEYKESSRLLIESCLTFMRNNVHRMEYKRFRDNGWPIGSGPVEGACKNIVKKRMCQSGQRWGLRGGQSILSLRAVVKSDRWPLFWNAYKKLSRSPSFSQST